MESHMDGPQYGNMTVRVMQITHDVHLNPGMWDAESRSVEAILCKQNKTK